LGECAEAEDVLQEVYLTVWQKAVAFDPTRASPIAWLATIARNARSTGYARPENCRMEAIEVATDIVDPVPGGDSTLEGRETSAKLYTCLDALAERERTAWRASFFDGNTYEELAARLGLPLGTMKSMIRRAMIKLKACLEQ
jgi:RNA polymerase sigma factor (sigma-70 family)